MDEILKRNIDKRVLVLYCANGMSCDALRLANEIKKIFPELLNPLITPIDDNILLDFPYMNFSQNNNFQIQVSRRSVLVSLSDDLVSGKETIYKKLLPVLDAFLKFNRIGYVSIFHLNPKEREKFAKNYFVKDYVRRSKSFVLGWYDDVEINNLTVNMWRRYTYDDILKSFEETFDFNTKPDVEDGSLDINTNFALGFIKSCDNMICSVKNTQE